MSERIRGAGKIFRGSEFVTDIRYKVQLTWRYKTTRTINSVIRVFLGRDIRIRLNPVENIAKRVGERLTLHFGVSRRLDFVVASGTGDCSASGELYTSRTLARVHAKAR
jgi:hypothetical protein